MIDEQRASHPRQNYTATATYLPLLLQTIKIHKPNARYSSAIPSSSILTPIWLSSKSPSSTRCFLAVRLINLLLVLLEDALAVELLRRSDESLH